MNTLFPTVFGKAALATAALSGFLLFAGAPGAKANDWDDSNRRVAYAEGRYRESVERFGPYNRDAQHWYHERHEAYERAEHYRYEWREHHHDRDDRYRGDWDRR
jgi:hypothetical protein